MYWMKDFFKNYLICIHKLAKVLEDKGERMSEVKRPQRGWSKSSWSLLWEQIRVNWASIPVALGGKGEGRRKSPVLSKIGSPAGGPPKLGPHAAGSSMHRWARNFTQHNQQRTTGRRASPEPPYLTQWVCKDHRTMTMGPTCLSSVHGIFMYIVHILDQNTSLNKFQMTGKLKSGFPSHSSTKLEINNQKGH